MSFEYKSIIIDTIEDIKERKDPKSPVLFRHNLGNGKFDEYSIPYDKYVLLLFETILIYNNTNVGQRMDGLTKFLYNKVTNKRKEICSYVLQIFPEKKKIEYTEIRENKSRVEKSIQYNEDFSTLSNLIYKRAKKCQFTAISVDIYTESSAHRNVVLCEYDNSSKKVMLNYYEPHGTLKGFSKKYGIIDILDKLKKDSNGFINYNYNNIACPYGIQSELYGLDIGYCVMFSFLWIYIVLEIIMYNLQHNTYIPSYNWIGKVEEYYLDRYDKYSLYGKTVTFAGNIFVDYIESNYNDQQKVILDGYIYRYIQQNTHEFKKVRSNVRYRNVKNIDSNNSSDSEDDSLSLESKDNSEDDPEVTYESWRKAKLKESGYDDIKVEDEENILTEEIDKEGRWYNYLKSKIYGNKIGQLCRKNSDCISKRCIQSADGNYCGASVRSGQSS